ASGHTLFPYTTLFRSTGEKRSAERLCAALDHADQRREDEEVGGGGHEVPENADPHVNQQADEDGVLRTYAAGDVAEEDRERNARSEEHTSELQSREKL